MTGVAQGKLREEARETKVEKRRGKNLSKAEGRE
jgi:hypothetical protein